MSFSLRIIQYSIIVLCRPTHWTNYMSPVESCAWHGGPVEHCDIGLYSSKRMRTLVHPSFRPLVYGSCPHTVYFVRRLGPKPAWNKYFGRRGKDEGNANLASPPQEISPHTISYLIVLPVTRQTTFPLISQPLNLSTPKGMKD